MRFRLRACSNKAAQERAVPVRGVRRAVSGNAGEERGCKARHESVGGAGPSSGDGGQGCLEPRLELGRDVLGGTRAAAIRRGLGQHALRAAGTCQLAGTRGGATGKVVAGRATARTRRLRAGVRAGQEGLVSWLLV